MWSSLVQRQPPRSVGRPATLLEKSMFASHWHAETGDGHGRSDGWLAVSLRDDDCLRRDRLRPQWPTVRHLGLTGHAQRYGEEPRRHPRQGSEGATSVSVNSLVLEASPRDSQHFDATVRTAKVRPYGTLDDLAVHWSGKEGPECIACGGTTTTTGRMVNSGRVEGSLHDSQLLGMPRIRP